MAQIRRGREPRLGGREEVEVLLMYSRFPGRKERIYQLSIDTVMQIVSPEEVNKSMMREVNGLQRPRVSINGVCRS